MVKAGNKVNGDKRHLRIHLERWHKEKDGGQKREIARSEGKESSDCGRRRKYGEWRVMKRRKDTFGKVAKRKRWGTNGKNNKK